MRRMLVPSEWPITLKAPLMVMFLMLAISFVVSNTVLRRLADAQERNLQSLSQAYLDGLSVMLLPNILREDVWEVFDALDRARTAHAGLNALNTFVLTTANRVIAATEPKNFPVGKLIDPEILLGFSSYGGLRIDENKRTARVRNAVMVQGKTVGSIYTELDISALLSERQAVLWQLIATNAGLTLSLMLIGYWAVRRMVKPVRTLSAFLDRASDGPIEMIPDDQLRIATGEFGRLFRRYNAMALAANERLQLAEKLAAKERLASLGQLASGMAHEINNPLGGLFNAIDAIKRYGDRQTVRETSIQLLERGLTGIRDTVRAVLMTYRVPTDCRVLRHDDIEDLQYLVQPALRQKRLTLEWTNLLRGEVALPATSVRDAALNLLLNACAASPDGSSITFVARPTDDALEICIGDHGSGLPESYRHLLEKGGPIGVPKAGGGLGTWMVRRLVDAAGGAARVEASSAGTTVYLSFPINVKEARDVA
jgi:signal transduction histidine kinase